LELFSITWNFQKTKFHRSQCWQGLCVLAPFWAKCNQNKKIMKHNFFCRAAIFTLFLLAARLSFAVGEPSTYFNIFVPPNNDNVQRNVCLVVTAIYDSTAFSITDDGMDGDTDDSVSGMLMAGQSYILYIKDNGINDDALYASGGTLKQDGDYFIITAGKIVYASQSTNSDWQHDWVPATNKTGMGQKFIVYAPKISGSNRDLNAFVYSDSTQVTIRKISSSPTQQTGYTNVNMYNGSIVVQKMLHRGQDLIYSGSEGRDLMISGETYVVEANKPITLQYGALFGNERDGGGYVPSSNGSSAGNLFYFGVPFQSGTSGEQEIRVVSLDASNVVTLERYSSGTWTAVKTWSLGLRTAGDWVGKNYSNVNYATVFRITCSAGKRVSVFEANWLETGSVGTSDIGTMCSSLDGTSSGNDFLIYMAPPGNEQNVKNPFTGSLFGQQLTHAYLFSSNDTCHITVKDAYTNGLDLSKTFTILPGRYADCALTVTEWKSIYNGTGNTSGPERPYLLIHSDRPISVMNTNFNDNWMMYFGTALEQSFSQNSSASQNTAKPGDTVTVSSQVVFNGSMNIDSAFVSINVGSGAKVTGSSLNNSNLNTSIPGSVSETGKNTHITFPVQDSLSPQYNYLITTTLVPMVMDNNGLLLQNNAVISVETMVQGDVNGVNQQSSATKGVCIQSANTSNFMFNLGNFNADLSNSWTANVIDLNADGFEDIYVTDKDAGASNLYFQNNGNNTFTKTSLGPLTSDKAITVCSAWADYDNDGDQDLLMVNNTQKPNFLYRNDGGSFSKAQNTGLSNQPAYYHAGSFADYDNDGWLDLFVSNYMPTKFNELYHNKGDGTYERVTGQPMTSESFMSLGATWADYDNDGDQDLFVPNSDGANNSFFQNNGNGTFSKLSALNICNDGGNSVASCWGDINNDGWLDLYVANASNENDFLYLNNQNGGFNKITSGPVVNSGGHSHGCSFADVDNDMDLDLYVSNDKGLKFLFLNDGTGNFTRNYDEVITANYGNSMGNYFFDADRDGDLDLFVATHSGQKNYFFTNNGNSNHWASFKLIGNISNKDAIGARIRVKCGGIWQSRELNSQSGIGGQSSARAHFGLGAGTVADSVQVIWPSGYVQTVTNFATNAFYTINEPAGATISGQAYFDANGNCSKDPGENEIVHIRLGLGNGFYAVTNNNGAYKTMVPVGNYTVDVQPQGIWLGGCAVASFSTTVFSTVTVNVPVTTTVSGVDLKVNIGATAMRRGFKNQAVLNIDNLGSSSAFQVPLTLSLGGHMKIMSSVPAFSVNSNGICHWMLDTIKPGQSITISLIDSVFVSRQIGGSLSFTVDADYQGDLDKTNNTFVYNTEVVGAIDPNDLLVSPRGLSDSGFVKPGTLLTYMVRFQNVGNYKASQVIVNDQLPDGFDLEKLQLVSSSHPCNFSFDKTGRVKVVFEQIELPDSTANAQASQGFVVFSAPLIDASGENVTVKNKAFIQFDYEDPLNTNMVMNTLTGDLQTEHLLVFPNPSAGVFNLQLLSSHEQYQSGNQLVSVMVYDLLGTVINTQGLTNGQSKINLNGYQPGYYTLLAIDAQGNRYVSKLVLIR
jgi:uncharacterized repeat protein (TIGR01451 family)